MRVAVAIADAEGIAAVSMRRIAREHAVTPMALYWHFADRDRLLDAMAEQVVADTRFHDEPGAVWEERYRQVLTDLVQLLRAHPWMGRLVIERLVPLPKYLAALEIMLDCTRVAGLSPQVGAVLAQQAVQSVVALTECEPGSPSPAKDRDECADLLDFFDGPGVEALPNVRAAAVHLTSPPDPEEYFRLGIATILGGVRAVADAG